MPNFAANLSLLYPELPFLERFVAAARDGFLGVEYLFPYSWPAQELRDRLVDNGLTQVLFNLPPGDWDAGERGIACLPGRTAEFEDGLGQALEYARVLGCRQINCLAGLRPESLTESEARDTLVENLRRAARKLAPEGITLMVEAINTRVDMPGFVLDTAETALAVIDATGEPNIRLQYDIYHMQIMSGDLVRSIERHLDRIGHIQFADNPGRHEPGTGEINFGSIFSALDRMGYSGWVSAEYHPSVATPETLSWLKSATAS
ncbi:hydroxypyruvate isomerase [Marinobacter nanhaiticus D15-8W]|uniref:Hydroxypyruvate isomerase n=1 Tax=Marinobacter nanhaiticus D15-8W TaxID=626887 RepID=N6WV52_9GAMM|nr:hydroxypyruvate isomerase [Marinobacter nanhaiticus]ENO15466.1 hydroxypyruvate isomerase [Marinobacter nanhaiticus D15-8W]BES73684.1 hydroxypyruvate isomerase [Marinobacter nanhaiticus D15-8W]